MKRWPIFALVLLTGPLVLHGQDLFTVVRSGTPEQVRAAIRDGAKDGAQIDELDSRGFPAFAIAAGQNRDPEVIRTLVSAGAKVDVASKDNLTPLTYAAWTNPNPEVLKALLDAGAAPDGIDNKWKRTPLMFAAAGNTPAVLKVLLAAGADPKLKSSEGKTSYDYAQGNERLKNDAVCEELDRERFNDQKARAAYAEGLSALQSGSYADAASHLSAAATLLGRTNIRIQPPLIRALFGLRDYPRAMKETEAYLALKPDQDGAEYTDILATQKSVRNSLAQDEADSKQAVTQRSESRCKLYLATYPFGLHAAQVAALLDDLGWEKAAGAGTWDAYTSYLNSFPSGVHRDDATQAAAALLVIKDDGAWSQALSRNSIDSFKGYLSLYPRGRHSVDAGAKLSALQTADRERKEQLAQARRIEQKKEYEALAGRYRGEATSNYLFAALEVAGLAGAGVLLYLGVTNDDSTLTIVSGALAGASLPLCFMLLPRQLSNGDTASKNARDNEEAARGLSLSVAPHLERGAHGLRWDGLSFAISLK